MTSRQSEKRKSNHRTRWVGVSSSFRWVGVAHVWVAIVKWGACSAWFGLFCLLTATHDDRTPSRSYPCSLSAFVTNLEGSNDNFSGNSLLLLIIFTVGIPPLLPRLFAWVVSFAPFRWTTLVGLNWVGYLPRFLHCFKNFCQHSGHVIVWGEGASYFRPNLAIHSMPSTQCF